MIWMFAHAHLDISTMTTNLKSKHPRAEARAPQHLISCVLDQSAKTPEQAPEDQGVEYFNNQFTGKVFHYDTEDSTRAASSTCWPSAQRCCSARTAC